MLMNSSIYCTIKNISNTNTTKPDSRNKKYFNNYIEIKNIYLDFPRPALESPSTRILDKCKHRQASDTPCNVRINDDICTTYSQISDSAKRLV